MRIYAAADIHVKHYRMELIREMVRVHQPDVVVAAGDIASYFEYRPVLDSLSLLPVPVLMVRGNSDMFMPKSALRQYENITDLHLNRIEFDGFSFVGASGTIPIPFNSKIRLREQALRNRLEALVDDLTILVAHPPPYGVLDEVLGRYHAGCRMIRNVIAKRGPALFICGHIHESSGCKIYKKTLVVNCSIGKTGAGAIIDIDRGGGPKVKMLDAET